ncbi:Hypothetical Protein RradSPS_2602 [Rubrobacter radiotolerans]|uniref:Uncharacterized protein n=1 Tax=Rubrobacter radiotolerans TaxID=42256 RepID=A0A023X771_RUBRA|nr:hypothetical protein [Rubrobacter radiotolerans]AHY47885.1 Hypothetical Protein RradSPS_2602 [Rubrobacter radiotolerans]MDX5892523.1 hypothetical protein [Rubrobacter radiotolerans]SMC07814.1 E3 binding protein [Rubrobacter radiotolerans DSM 5868]
MIRTVLENESFLEDARRFLDNYASLERVFQDAAEEYFGRLRLSTRSDSSRVAALVVGLDAKTDRVEEMVEELEYSHERLATVEAVDALKDCIEELEKRQEDSRSGLERVEDKLDRLQALLESSIKDGPRATGSRKQGEVTDASRRKAR